MGHLAGDVGVHPALYPFVKKSFTVPRTEKEVRLIFGIRRPFNFPTNCISDKQNPYILFPNQSFH